MVADTKANMKLSDWLKRITEAESRSQIFLILDEFRPLTWTDNERSQMARHYMKILDYLPVEDSADDSSASSENKANEGEDGPVWYEKM